MNKIDQNVTGLKLAYIIGTYPSLTTTFIDREVQILRQVGADIQILSIRRPSPEVFSIDKYGQIQNSIIYLLPVKWLQFILAHLYFLVFRPVAYFKTLGYLFTRPHPGFRLRLKTILHFGEGVYAAYLLREGPYDHVHAHFIDRASTVALCVSRLLRLPYSLTAHARSIYNNPVLIYEKISGSKFTVTVSKFNKAHFLEQYPNLDGGKIFVLHPWVEMSRFQPPESRPTHSRFRILSVGRLVEKKGHQYLIEACNLLQKDGLDFECRIIGDGPLMHDLESIVSSYNLESRVHLMGGQPQSVVLSSLGQADLFVLACVIAKNGDRDGMPVALAEAMAMELPVISTDIVGISELVQPGSGYLVPPFDAAALADAIKIVYMAEDQTRIEMGRYGREIISKEFDLYKGIQFLASLFYMSSQQEKAVSLTDDELKSVGQSTN